MIGKVPIQFHPGNTAVTTKQWRHDLLKFWDENQP